MKYTLLFLLVGLTSSLAMAQGTSSEVDLAEHRVVFQITSADTNVQKMLLKQLSNLMAAAPNTKMEVVSHGPGISMMQTNQTRFQPKIMELKSKGVEFVVCENAMRERNVTRAEILPEASFVKAGILELITKQEQGWSYIRAGQ